MPLNIINSLTIGKYAKKAADPYIWVAVANTIIATVNTSIIIRSTNGDSWEAVSSNGGLSSSWDVAYNNGLWLATSQSGSLIIRSTDDGKTWSSTGDKGGILSTKSIAYGKDNNNNGLWVVVGEGSRIASSPDGNIWTAATWVAPITVTSFSSVRDVAYGNGLWVAVGYSNPTIAKSTDGKSWSGVTQFSGGTALAVAYGNGVWIVVYGGGSIIVRSTDGGATWSAVLAGSLGGFQGGGCVAYGEDGAGNGRWVAGGLSYKTGPKIVFSSDNGASWSAAASPAGITAGHSVVYGQDGAGNGRWVIVGEGGSKIAYSSNGSEWTAAASNGGVTGTNSDVRGVAFKI